MISIMFCFGTEFFQDWNVISALSNIIMAAIAFVALGYSIKQNYDLKKQRQEDERGRLVFSFIIADKAYFLKIENIGKKTVYNLNFSINDEFLDNMYSTELRNYLTEVTSKHIHITAGSSKLYAVSFIEQLHPDIDKNLESLKYTPILIKGTFNGIYKFEEKFTMDEFTGSMLIKDPIQNELSNINKSILETNRILKK